MSTELEFEIVDFDGKAPRVLATPGDWAEWETMVVTVNTKAYATTGRVQPFGLFGAGFMRTELKHRRQITDIKIFDDTSAAFTLRLGGGVDFYITKHIVMSAGAHYILPFGGKLDKMDMLMYNMGLQYRF